MHMRIEHYVSLCPEAKRSSLSAAPDVSQTM